MNETTRQHATPTGPDARRVAELLVDLDGHGRRGSGYLIKDNLVLTAAHVVTKSVAIKVRFEANKIAAQLIPAVVEWVDEEADIAVLRMQPTFQVAAAPPAIGTIGRRAATVEAHVVGFPRWKLRVDSTGKPFRDAHHAVGRIAALSNTKAGTLEIAVDPPAADPVPDVSPWEAMSGAAVWVAGCVVGIVSAHHRREGLGRLTAVRLDRYLGSADQDVLRDELAALLGLSDRRASLVDVLAIAGTDKAIVPEQAEAPGRPIPEWADPLALEIHPAIDLGDPQTRLPLYVVRRHDNLLKAVILRAANGQSTIATLVGGASTGKTRACWEAVQALPANWRIWHPIDPSRPDAAIADIRRVGPRTVVWLNDAHFYLLTANPQVGEQVAAGLRELLRSTERGPVLVLATTWPMHWETLVKLPAPPALDSHAQARALLTNSALGVPDSFTKEDLRQLRLQAKRDSRLADALANAQHGEVAQYLAGAPKIIERYRLAPPWARAVIDAAIDARRLGHSPAVPVALIETAALGYLTQREIEEGGEDWFDRGMEYATAPCRGARGPLSPAPTAHRVDLFRVGHYRVADYLEQTEQTSRSGKSAPATLWEAFVSHGARQDLSRLADAAGRMRLYRFAYSLNVAAADSGELAALLEVGHLLVAAGHLDEALAWYQRAGDNGSAEAMIEAAFALADAGRIDESVSWWERTASGLYGRRKDDAPDVVTGSDSHFAMVAAGDTLADADRLDEALRWYERGADADSLEMTWFDQDIVLRHGDDYRPPRGRRGNVIREPFNNTGSQLALLHGARRLWAVGRIGEALEWYERAADPGRSQLWRLYQRCITARSPDNMELDNFLRVNANALAYLMGQRSDHMNQYGPENHEDLGEYARAWFRRAVESGAHTAMIEVARKLEQSGHFDEAVAWYARVAESGSGVLVCDGAGRLSVALYPYYSGSYPYVGTIPHLMYFAISVDIAVYEAARAVVHAGGTSEAIPWLQRLPIQREDIAFRRLSRDIALRGRALIGLSLLESLEVAAQAGDDDARTLKARAEAAGWRETFDEALTSPPREPAGFSVAQVLESKAWFARQRREAHRDHGLLDLDAELVALERAASGGDARALARAAELLYLARRLEESVEFYLRSAEMGEAGFSDAYLGLRDLERPAEAERLRRYGVDVGGTVAVPWPSDDRSAADDDPSASSARSGEAMPRPPGWAEDDPRPYLVRRDYDGRLLAESPDDLDVVRRWKEGESLAGKALVSAAVDMHRCGYPAIELPLLRRITATYLDPDVRADGLPDHWFADALTWACAPTAGGPPMVVLDPDSSRGPCCRVVDLLQAIASVDPGTPSVPVRTWQFVVDHVPVEATSAVLETL